MLSVLKIAHIIPPIPSYHSQYRRLPPQNTPAPNICVCLCVCVRETHKGTGSGLVLSDTLRTDVVLVCPGSADGNDDDDDADDDHGCHGCRCCSNINTTYDNSIKSQYITEASVV